MKRFFDIIFSGLAMLLFLPFSIPIVLILRFTGENEVFYIQQRVGYGGNMFGLYKFATMLKDSPNMKMGTITMKDDPRVLPFGKFLRKTKVNELPQLINVLIGDMSIIGPRPQTERCFLAFPKDSQDIIKKMKPGLSGIGSIIFRNEESLLDDESIDRIKFYDEVIAPYKGEVEKWFIMHQDLFTYFKLIGLTIWVVIFPRSNVYKNIFPTLPEPPKELENILL